MKRRRAQAVPLHPTSDEALWLADRVDFAWLLVMIAWLYLLGVLFQEVWR